SETTAPASLEPAYTEVPDSRRATTGVAGFPVTPPVVALYRQLKALRVVDGIQSVLELGSSPLDCPSLLVDELLRMYGRPVATAKSVRSDSGREVPRSRTLYEALGWTCTTLDQGGGSSTVKLDLEFEMAPADQTNRYDLVTNIGTGACLLNQRNVFAST